MLKEILSISGRPGLFKLVSYGKNLIVVENLSDKKRIPAHSRDKIISLGDIAIYTESEEIPLNEVFEKIRIRFEGKVLDAKSYSKPEELKAFFADILPDYDREKVYNNDIKKIITWYNLLINYGYTSFKNEEKSEETEKTKDVE